MRIRDILGIGERRQRQATRFMQVFLTINLGIGVISRNPTTAVNAGISLGVTFLPAVLERDYRIPMDAGVTLWITTAVFLHTLGSMGTYGAVWWWDHLTHALSASVVAGAGYAVVRAVDEHNPSIDLPGRMMFAFILIFVVAFGVVWEVLEFAIAETSRVLPIRPVLAQHGLEDTMMDLLFDVVGGVVLGLWGTVYLSDVTEGVKERIAARTRSE